MSDREEPKTSGTKGIYEFDRFFVDSVNRLLLCDGKEVQLTGKVFDILLVFIENRGRLLTKEELMEKVWQDRFVEEGNLARNVSTLRKALGKDNKENKYIITAPGRGYRFVAELKPSQGYIVEHRSVSEIIIEHETDDGNNALVERKKITPAKKSLVSNKAIFLLALIVLLLPASIFTYRYFRHTDNPQNKTSLRFNEVHLARLTKNMFGYGGVISPDGKSFVYMTGEVNNGLVLQDIATGRVTEFVAPKPKITYWGARFSPDSQKVYYIVTDELRIKGQLRRVSIFGGESEFIADNLVGLAVSPDGNRVAFARMISGTISLIVHDLTNGNEQTLRKMDFSSFYMSLDWSPDGNSIMYAFYQHQAEKDSWYVAELPCCGIEKPEEKIIVPPRSTKIIMAIWLHDKSGLIMNAVDDATGIPQLWQVGYPNGELERITNDLATYKEISISNDGKNLLTEQVNVNARLWFAPEGDVNNAQPLPTIFGRDFRGLNWTRAGQIIFAANDGKSWNIWKSSPDGNIRQQLTKGTGQNYEPAISPDGKTIVFVSRHSGSPQLWRMNVDGSQSEQLTTMPAQVDDPQFTPDGKFVFFTHYLRGRPYLWKASVTGNDAKQVMETIVSYWAISPDGEKLAYSYFDEKSNKALLVVRKIDDPTILQIFETDPGRFLHWTPDGSGLVYAITEDGKENVWLQPIDGSKARQLTNFKTDYVLEFAWAREGKDLVFINSNVSFDVVLFSRTSK